MSDYDAIHLSHTEQLRVKHKELLAYQKLADRATNRFLMSAAANIALVIWLVFDCYEGT